MRSKIENTLNIHVCGVNLTELQNIEFYIRQGTQFFQYTPEIIDYNNMIIKMPYKDAMQLLPNVKAKLQFAFTDNNGNSNASDIIEMLVQDLLKSEGYNDGGDAKVQEKTVIPTFHVQIVNPDAGYDYLSKVTVEAIPYSVVENEYNGETLIIGKKANA